MKTKRTMTEALEMRNEFDVLKLGINKGYDSLNKEINEKVEKFFSQIPKSQKEERS